MILRIVITTTLNQNLFHAKLVPLLRSYSDVDVVVVSDQQGFRYDRVKWVWPRGLMALLGRLGGRLPLLFREIVNSRTRLVMAYGLTPHGLFAVAIGHMFRRPVWIHFIGGQAEIQFAHDKLVADNRVILASRNPRRLERIARWTARKADLILVPGSSTRRFLIQQGYAPDRVIILHSAIDPERFHPADVQRDIDVIVSAQLRERKRPIFTLQVLRQILDKHPNARFCWLGGGPMHSQFEKAVDTLGLRQHLTRIQTHEVAKYYQRAKVFLLCSVSEGLSLACMEAMACGTVPVTSECGDMSDIVRTGETGELLPVDVPANVYAGAVLRLLEDRDLRGAYSRASAVFIRQNHSFEQATANWQGLLQRIVNERSPRRPRAGRPAAP